MASVVAGSAGGVVRLVQSENRFSPTDFRFFGKLTLVRLEQLPNAFLPMDVTVSGIVMLVGLDCGQTEGSDREGKSACYKVVQDLLAKSKEENGSVICAEILGLKGYEKANSSYVASARTAEYYKTRPCAAKVESAARIFANYLKAK